MKTKTLFSAAILVFLIFLVSEIAHAQCSSAVEGYDQYATLMGAVRYRNFGSGTGGRIYLGTNLGASGGRVENAFYRGLTCDGQTPYNSWQPSNHVKFWYDPIAGKIYSRVTVGAYDYCLEYTVGNLGDGVNYLQIEVFNRYVGSTVEFKNVTVDSILLGDFVDSDDPTGKTWMVKCNNLSDGFTIEGDVILGGTQPTSAETNRAEIKFGHTEATLITLSSFQVKPGDKSVTLQWKTESEIENAGFNLYRADSENGAYVKINADLIPAEGSATGGASYAFTDTGVKNSRTYYYRLEDIDLNGTATMHGPVSATPRWLFGIFGK